MEIQCGNHFCIYYDNAVCLLNSVSLDIVGLCSNCIYVDIEQEYLATQRKRLLRELEQPDDAWRPVT